MLADFSQYIIFPLLFFTGLVAGTIDAIAGGGGLISLPMLLSVGIPPHIALGTNKLQGTIGTLVATWSYHRHGLLSMRNVYQGLIFGFIGAAVGSISAQIMSSDLLKKIIPFLLIFILLYTVMVPRMGLKERPPRVNEIGFYCLFGLILGFYDGFLGPGTGAFWMFSLTFFLGFNLIKATAYTKIFNLNSNLVALGCFAIGGNIDYRAGFCMAAGQFIGGRLGALLTIKKGAEFIRPIFIVMVTATILTLLYKNYK